MLKTYFAIKLPNKNCYTPLFPYVREIFPDSHTKVQPPPRLGLSSSSALGYQVRADSNPK